MTPKPSVVRCAGPDDEPALFEILMLAHEENGFAAVNETKVWAAIHKGTRPDPQTGRMGFIGVIDGPGATNGVEATIGLVLVQPWYSEAWHFEDLWNFVHPECRQSNHARKLLRFAKWAADQMGVRLITGVMSTHRTAAKIRLMQRELQQVGATFLYGGTLEGAVNQRHVTAADHSHPRGGRSLTPEERLRLRDKPAARLRVH